MAIGSRRQETAEEFADKLGVSRRHGSYQDLANDPEVDVIYVSTPHSAHKEVTLLCLAAGKPVLCEKPFAINAGEASAGTAPVLTGCGANIRPRLSKAIYTAEMESMVLSFMRSSPFQIFPTILIRR